MKLFKDESKDSKDSSPLQSRRKKNPINRYGEWDYSFIAYCCALTIVDPLESTLYDEVKGIGGWKDAIKEEILALKKEWDLWYFVPLPSGISFVFLVSEFIRWKKRMIVLLNATKLGL